MEGNCDGSEVGIKVGKLRDDEVEGNTAWITAPILSTRKIGCVIFHHEASGYGMMYR